MQDYCTGPHSWECSGAGCTQSECEGHCASNWYLAHVPRADNNCHCKDECTYNGMGTADVYARKPDHAGHSGAVVWEFYVVDYTTSKAKFGVLCTPERDSSGAPNIYVSIDDRCLPDAAGGCVADMMTQIPITPSGGTGWTWLEVDAGTLTQGAHTFKIHLGEDGVMVAGVRVEDASGDIQFITGACRPSTERCAR